MLGGVGGGRGHLDANKHDKHAHKYRITIQRWLSSPVLLLSSWASSDLEVETDRTENSSSTLPPSALDEWCRSVSGDQGYPARRSNHIRVKVCLFMN